MRAAIPLLALALVGCGPKKSALESAGVSLQLQQWAPPAKRFEFTLITVAMDIQMPDKRVAMVWGEPRIDGDEVYYDVVLERIDGKEPGPIETHHHVYGPNGLQVVGITKAGGERVDWLPPITLLPAVPKVGDTWAMTHKRGDLTGEREVEIMRSSFCDGGLTAVSDLKLSNGERLAVRDHYCPGVGFAGFESLLQRPEQPTQRTWSEKGIRDGRGIADPVVE